MKKLLIILLNIAIIIVTVSLAACGSGNGEETGSSENLGTSEEASSKLESIYWEGWETHEAYSKLPKLESGYIKTEPYYFAGYCCLIKDVTFEEYKEYVDILKADGFVSEDDARAEAGNPSFINIERGVIVYLTHSYYYYVAFDDTGYENLEKDSLDMRVETIVAANAMNWESFEFLEGLPKYEGDGYFNLNGSVINSDEYDRLILRKVSELEARTYILTVDSTADIDAFIRTGEAEGTINGKTVRFKYNGNFNIDVYK